VKIATLSPTTMVISQAIQLNCSAVSRPLMGDTVHGLPTACLEGGKAIGGLLSPKEFDQCQ